MGIPRVWAAALSEACASLGFRLGLALASGSQVSLYSHHSAECSLGTLASQFTLTVPHYSLVVLALTALAVLRVAVL